MNTTMKMIIPTVLHRSSLGVILLVFLSGCLSTVAPTKPSVMQQIQQQEIKDTIEKHVAEFKTIKPAIERLIAMENDFKVMVSQIAQINNPGGATDSVSQLSAYDPELTPVSLDPHNNTPDLEVLYVSDTAAEPEPIFAIEPISPPQVLIAEQVTSPSANSEAEPVVIFQAAEPASATVSEPQRRIAQVRLFPATSYTSCAPLGVTSDARKYGIHVASYNTLDSLPRGWHESVQRFPDFCQKGAVIQKVVVKSKAFYSMRVGPYVSRSEAKSICYALKKQKQYCRVTDFTGETL